MLTKKKILTVSILLIVCILAVAGWWYFFNQSRTADYEVVYLPCDTAVSCFATKINNPGQVAGILGKTGEGFFWQEDTELVTFGDNEVKIISIADINDKGHVVGLCEKYDTPGRRRFQAYIWDKNTGLRLISGAEEYVYSQMAINNHGHVAGAIYPYDDATGQTGKGLLYLWNANDGIRIIDDLEAALSYVVGFSDTGQAGGAAEDNNGILRGFVWDKSNGISLTGPEISISGVHDLDDKGRLWVTTQLPNIQLIVWDKNSGITKLGTFGFDSIENCMTTTGQKFIGIGSYYPIQLLNYRLSGPRMHCFFRDSNGDVFRFNGLFKKGDFWARDINDNGWIVGYELDKKRVSPTRAVLLKSKKK